MNIFIFYAVFCCILLARLYSAVYLHITDCDETYNYWEPLHYLVYGKGFQTWEYSPMYGLRSYLYLIIHAAPAWALKGLLAVNSSTIFYCTRSVFAVICAALETQMFRSICRVYGVEIGNVWLMAQLVIPGMFIASTALLPSTFSMYLTMAFLSAWWRKQYKLAIFTIVVSTLVGWPFAALVSLPFLYDVLIKHRLFRFFITWSIIGAASIGTLLLAVDSYFYGKITFAPLNIITYNIFSSHGPNIFGVESKYFYFLNLFLNFNMIWLFALIYPFLVVISKMQANFSGSRKIWFRSGSLWRTSPLYIWILVFFAQPHKEERFLFPVYPLITLCGTLCVYDITKSIQNFITQTITKNRKIYSMIYKTTLLGLSIAFIIMSVSRSYALYNSYHAPMEICQELEASHVEQNICIGKEWHRFPGSFFVPNNYRLRFIRSHFEGILPAYFDETERGSTTVHQYFNNLNRANDYMLFDYSMCDYLIDVDFGKEYRPEEVEPNYSRDSETWIVLKSIPFLHSNKSHKLFRAFYIPLLHSNYVEFGSYNILKRKL